MRIAVLTNAYPPKAQGGAGRIAFEYTKILEGLGNEVRVWGPGEEFFGLGKKSAAARLLFHLNDLKERKDAVEGIAAWEPEVLFTHNLTGCGFGTPARIKKSLDSAKWIHVLHDVQLFEPSGQILYKEKFRILRQGWRWTWARLRRSSLGDPDAVISPTKWLMDEHLKRGFFKATKQVILPNPVSHSDRDGGIFGRGNLSAALETARKDDEAAEADGLTTKRADGAPRNGKQILFVGRLDFDKGIDLLLRAWPKLKKYCDRLVVVGGGERLEDFKKQYPDVDFKGPLAPEDVMRVMAQSGVLVMPSLVLENQPTVIIEALACGCKVVASDVGGVRGTLGDAGWIFKPGSIEELDRAVKEAIAGLGAYGHAPGSSDEILRNHEPGTAAGVLGGLLKSNL